MDFSDLCSDPDFTDYDYKCLECHSENTEIFIFESYDYPVSKYTCLRCLDCKKERVLTIEPLYQDEDERNEE